MAPFGKTRPIIALSIPLTLIAFCGGCEAPVQTPVAQTPVSTPVAQPTPRIIAHYSNGQIFRLGASRYRAIGDVYVHADGTVSGGGVEILGP